MPEAKGEIEQSQELAESTTIEYRTKDRRGGEMTRFLAPH